MPNPIQPPAPLLGLQKAQSIGADPRAEALRQMDNSRLDASIPNPENKGLGALDALSRMVRQYHGPVQETLGEWNPDFTPVGGEGLFNAARGAKVKATDMAERAYETIMSTMGRK